MELYGVHWGGVGPYGAVWGHVGLYGAVWGFKGHVGPYGAVWGGAALTEGSSARRSAAIGGR